MKRVLPTGNPLPMATNDRWTEIPNFFLIGLLGALVLVTAGIALLILIPAAIYWHVQKNGTSNEKFGVLAIFGGAIGLHKFALGQSKKGVVWIVVCLLSGGLTFFIGGIHALHYLTMSPAEFERLRQASSDKYRLKDVKKSVVLALQIGTVVGGVFFGVPAIIMLIPVIGSENQLSLTFGVVTLAAALAVYPLTQAILEQRLTTEFRTIQTSSIVARVYNKIFVMTPINTLQKRLS